MTCIIIYDLIISVSQLPSTVKRWKPENFVCTLALLANSFLYKPNLEKIFNLKIWAPSIPSKQLWISIVSVSASPHQLWWLVLCFDLTELWGPQIFHQKCFSVCLWDCFFVCEIDIWMGRVSKMDYSPQCGWLSSNQLKSKKKNSDLPPSRRGREPLLPAPGCSCLTAELRYCFVSCFI